VRLLERHEVDDFLMCLAKAESDFSPDRAQRMRNVYDQLECDLFLLGATVVEDRLQDNVPETIEALHDADIKLWVLTGDKLETAESIGYSSSLLNPSMEIFRCTQALDIMKIPYRDGKLLNQAILIEAQALKVIYDNIQSKSQFLEICKTMRTVICCRLSPLQKAQVVKSVKDDDVDNITLAIGDGSNDCPMIKAADIGIGLFGKEGLRAVDTSDFAVT